MNHSRFNQQLSGVCLITCHPKYTYHDILQVQKHRQQTVVNTVANYGSSFGAAPQLHFGADADDKFPSRIVGGSAGAAAAAPPADDQVREFFPEAFLFSIATVE